MVPYLSGNITKTIIPFSKKKKNTRDDLVNDASAAVPWFHENHMVANPENFKV